MTLSSKWPVWQMASVTASNPRLKIINLKKMLWMPFDRTKAICGGKSCGGDFEFRVQNPPLRVFLLLCSSLFSLMLSPLRWSVEPPIHYFPPKAFPPSISLNHFNSAWHCISFSPQLVSCENFTNWLRVIKLCPILPIATKRDGITWKNLNFASKNIHV